MRARVVLVALGAALAAVSGCLPGDTRPVPESVYVSAEPSAAVIAGFTTTDGWHVSFDRLLVALGNVDFEGDEELCNSYAEAHYDRLYDFTAVAREKVGTIWGLGTCTIEFRIRVPSFDAILGPGATAADVAAMRIEGTDPVETLQRVSVVAQGTASRDGETKRFDLAFRRSYELTNCPTPDGTSFLTSVSLSEGATRELRLEVRGEELFRAQAEPDGELLFDRMLLADEDEDGTVTMDELGELPRPEFTGSEIQPPPDDDDAPPAPGPTYAHHLYEDLLPRLVRVVGGGACAKEERGGGRRF